MSSTPLDPLALLKSLDGRVKTASEHFRAMPPRPGSDESAPRIPTPPRRARGAPTPLEAIVPYAERLRSGEGSCVRVETRAALTGERSAHGYTCPAEPFACAALGESLALLARDDRWREVDPARIAFVDIETTSLSGSSGTHAFLVGLGFFEAGEFRVRQFLMEDYGDEPAMIDAIEAELARADAIVSYNGKRFDLPILRARWLMQRRAPRFPDMHLDLLYPARRLWRGRLPDCRLSTVEREVLGIMRVSDVESARIPAIYFDYARGIRREQMLPVLDHHAQDIFSLGAMLRTMAAAVEAPEDPRFGHAAEQWGLARIFQTAGRADAAIAALERAICAARDEDFGFRLSMQLAKRLQRAGRAEEAVEIWLARVSQARADRLDPLIELSKHHERSARDFASALRWARLAEAAAAGNSAIIAMHAIDRRVARLEGRASRPA